MKSIGITIFGLLFSFNAQAGTTLSGEVVGGPFRGSCQYVSGGRVKETYSFDTKPGEKIGAKLPNGIIQISNDSFNNKVAIAIYAAKEIRIVEEPPTLRGFRGEYDQREFLKALPSVSVLPLNSQFVPQGSFLGKENLQRFNNEGDSRFEWRELVAYEENEIAGPNVEFSDRIRLNIDAKTRLDCEVEYLDLFN